MNATLKTFPCVDCAADASNCRKTPCDCSCHPTSRFEAIGQEVGRLVATKQAAYGDSFGKSGAVMRALYPDGISTAQVDDALTIVRIVDKLFRIATDRDALGESPYRDIAGYSLLAVARVEASRQPRVTLQVQTAPGGQNRFVPVVPA